MQRFPAGLLLAILCIAQPFAAQDDGGSNGTFSEQSERQARRVLARAADALGGADALSAIKAIRVASTGKATYRLQSPSAQPPFEEGDNNTDLLLDLENRRLSFLSFNNEAGDIRHNLSLIGEGESRIYNLHARTFRPFATPSSFDRELAVHSRRAPQLLLRYALANPLQVRSLGEAPVDGRVHDVIAFPMADGVQVSAFVDRNSGLVSKIETLETDLLAGTATLETFFGDYAGDGIARAPRSVRTREAGQETSHGDLRIEIKPSLTAQSLAPEAADYRPVPASRPNPERIETITPGIHVFHSVSDPQHNALVVEFDRYVAVVDAPESSEASERLIARIGATIPGKPIRFVVLTHHHADHIGGLRSFVAAGASVITTPGNRALVEAFMAAPHDDRLAASPRPLQLDIVRNGKHVLSDGTMTLELIDVGPNPHAREILVAYFPKHRFLYQTDLFIMASNGAPVGPAFPALVAFAKTLDRLKLSPQRIAGGHGRTATIEEFRERVNFRFPEK